LDRAVADQQHGVGGRAVKAATDRERRGLWAYAREFVEQDLSEGGARARALIEGERANFGGGSAEEDLHAQHRAAAGDAGVGNNHVTRTAEPFDGWDQRDVEPVGGERIGEAAGEVKQEPCVGSRKLQSRLFKFVDQWLAVEVVNCTDSHDGLASLSFT
jgi:hypothetical protein